MNQKITTLSLATIIVTVAVFSCKPSNQTPAPKQVTAADIEQGKALLEKSDCMTCHKLDFKLIGPALKDIAAKYPANDSNYSHLAQKIIKGGSGVWGPVAMSPHADLPVADVTKIAQYILSIK